MGKARLTINEEINVVITLKVKFDQVSYEGEMSKQLMDAHIESAKNNMKDQILDMVVDEFCDQELSDGVKFNYKIENVENN